MIRAWSSIAITGGLALAACAGGETMSSADATASESSSGNPSLAESTGPGTTSGIMTPAGTSDSTGPGSTSDETADSSSSEGGCIPGTEDCTCDAEGACESALLCLGNVCQPSQCDGDLHEPNDDEATAVDLGMIDDSDDPGVFSASLHQPEDVDWFRYQGDDDFGSNVAPERELVSSGGLRLCKFLECDNGLAETEFECPPGTEYALSPMARPGCCASGGIALPDLNCTGVIEDNAMVYIRVDQPEEACVTYSVAYQY